MNLMCFNQTEKKKSRLRNHKKISLVKNVKAFNSLIQSNKVLSMVILGDFLIGSVTIIIRQIWNLRTLLMRSKTSFYLDYHLLQGMIAIHQLKIRLKVLLKNMKNQDFHNLILSNLYLLTHLWQTMQLVQVCRSQKRIQVCQWSKIRFN